MRFVGPVGRYSWRLILPVFYNGEIVSWTSRDVTDKAENPYISAPKAWEKRDIKHCLGGENLAKRYSRCIVVEGPGDAWRMGPGAVFTFGSAWTTAQAQLLAENWRKVYLMFDWDDEEAVDSARKLAELLDMVGTESEIIQPTGTDAGDPGGLQNETASELRKELGMDL